MQSAECRVQSERQRTGKRLWSFHSALCTLHSALCILFVTGCNGGPGPQHLAKAEIEIAGRRLAVEVARTPDQRQTGMMYRRALGPHEGMLFVFPRDEVLSFYMKNTYVPLSIAFIASDGSIANIAHMEPLSLRSHQSRLVCRYALEMPHGWFALNNVREGNRVTIPSTLAALE